MISLTKEIELYELLIEAIKKNKQRINSICAEAIFLRDQDYISKDQYDFIMDKIVHKVDSLKVVYEVKWAIIDGIVGIKKIPAEDYVKKMHYIWPPRSKTLRIKWLEKNLREARAKQNRLPK